MALHARSRGGAEGRKNPPVLTPLRQMRSTRLVHVYQSTGPITSPMVVTASTAPWWSPNWLVTTLW